MSNKQPLFPQKLIAIFLVAVLFFVQGVKLLHRHDYTPSRYHQAAADPHIAAGHYCAICDYHLAKDAELTPATGTQLLLSYQYISYPFRLSSSCAGMVQVHANKGPPAMML